jgi:DNA-binding XRE family transcriptional regulator
MEWVLASNIARRLKDLRQVMGWSHDDMADLVGRSPELIDDWERGKKEPPQSALKRLADEFEWSVAMFVEGGPMPSDVPDVIARAPQSGRAPSPPPRDRPPPARGAKRRTQPSPPAAKRRAAPSPAPPPRRAAAGAGWLLGEAPNAEQRFRSFLRGIASTAEAMVGDPSAVPSEEARQTQLAACRMAMRSCELAGQPVPEFVHHVHNQLIKGEFR